MNKMRRNLINLRWNLIKYIQFDGFINDVMFYFYLVAVMVGITGLTGFSYFRKMMSYVFRGTNLEFIVDFQGQIGQKRHLFSLCFFPGRAWRSRV